MSRYFAEGGFEAIPAAAAAVLDGFTCCFTCRRNNANEASASEASASQSA